MTRKLSPVPDAPRSGVDIAELRESLGVPASASLRAVEPSAALPTDGPARQRLLSAHSAVRDAIAGRDRCFTRRAELLDCEAIGTSRRQQLEADLARMLSAGDAPAARRAREGLEDLAVEIHPLAESLRQAEADFQSACNAVPRAEAALRQAALAAIAVDFDALLQLCVDTVRAARAAEHEVMALPRFLEAKGYDAWKCYELKTRINDALALCVPLQASGLNAPAPGARYVQQFTARLEQMLAGEEEITHVVNHQ